MTFGPIQFGGLASGLDTGAIISALLSVESRPIRLLESRKGTEQSKLSLIGTLEGLVENLQEKARELSSQGSFFAFNVDSGDESLATFSFTGTPIAGAHTLDVQALAAADRYTFDAVPDADADLGSGTISFDYDGTSYSVAASGSLNQIAAQINDEAGDAVTATVINAGTETSPSYRLVLAGDDTGVDFAIQNLSVGVAGLTGATNIVAASNAVALIDGISVQRSTNVFGGVVEGMSFTVHEEGSTSFTVSTDLEGTKDNVRELVDAYNEVIHFINQQNSYSPEAGPGGDLFGDPALRTIRSTISRALFDVDLATVQADTEGFSTLGLVGIDLESDGTLSIDDSKFDSKLSDNLQAMESLFSDPTTGVLVTLDEEIENLLDSTTNSLGDSIPGIFERRRDTISDVIERIDGDIERQEFRLEKLEESLIQRFSNLESLLGGLNAQASFLSSGLAFPA